MAPCAGSEGQRDGLQQQAPQLRFATTRLASGPRLHYAEQGDPSGEPIVFLPAYPDSWFSSSRVLACCLGATTPTPWTSAATATFERPDCCYSVEDFAADAVAVLDAARAERADLDAFMRQG
jgi:hypothetical protein